MRVPFFLHLAAAGVIIQTYIQPRTHPPVYFLSHKSTEERFTKERMLKAPGDKTSLSAE
jgi:hypothetical protein